MRAVFEAELRYIDDALIAMATLVQSAVTRAGAALLEPNLQLAQQVIDGDRDLDALHRSVDERCIHVLAQQAPVATDLRTVVSALQMSATLERMGDLAQHVAEVARGRYPAHAIAESARETFAAMVAAAEDATSRVTQLLRARELDLAMSVESDDDVLDDLHAETFATILGPSWSGTAQEAVDITLVGRYLERIGDHATSIARRIVFLVTGADGAVPTGPDGAVPAGPDGAAPTPHQPFA